MTDERIKQLMEQVGFPHSHSIGAMIEQVANEVEQEARADERKKCADRVTAINWHVPQSDDPIRTGYFRSGKEMQQCAIAAIMAGGKQ